MAKLIMMFWQVCTFKIGPQDLPSSSALMRTSILAYVLASILVSALSLSTGKALVSGILDVALVAAMTQLLLWIRELNARFQQTFIALMGSGAIIGFLALPLLAMQMAAGEQAAALPSLIIVGLMFWNVAIVGHILRHAIDAPFFVGVGIALIYMYVSVSVMRSLFTTPM